MEDNPDDYELMEFALLQANDRLQLRHFLSGSDALNFIFERSAHEGWQHRHLPVVIFSSSKNSVDMEEAYHIGANSYVVKPNGLKGLSAPLALWLTTGIP